MQTHDSHRDTLDDSWSEAGACLLTVLADRLQYLPFGSLHTLPPPICTTPISSQQHTPQATRHHTSPCATVPDAARQQQFHSQQQSRESYMDIMYIFQSMRSAQCSTSSAAHAEAKCCHRTNAVLNRYSARHQQHCAAASSTTA